MGAVGGILGAAVALLKAEHTVIALSAGIALVSLLWMHSLVSVFSLKRLTVPAAFYWAYFLMVYLPAHVIFLEDQGPAGWRYILAVLAVLALVPLGIALAQMVFRWSSRDTRRFFDRAAWPAVPLQAKSVWFLGLLVLSVVVIGLHVSRLPTIPVIYLIGNPGQAAMITALREGSLKTLAVPLWMSYLMAWTRNLFLPLLTMLCWGKYRVSRRRKWLTPHGSCRIPT
jgi:hypothetical protein